MNAINTSIDDTYHDISISSCFYPLYYTMIITLAIAIVMMTTTLILIPCHSQLRKRHHIFPFNLILADLSGGIAHICFVGVAEGQITISYEVIISIDIIVATSYLVSLLSIPFGARNIITTPRLIVTCVTTWAISFSISTPIAVTNPHDVFTLTLPLSWTTTIITGLCYIFIYRSIAKVPCDGNITRDRKEENQRVLRTFGLVFGTTVLCWVCPWVSWAFRSWAPRLGNDCLQVAEDIMIIVNWIANSIIYWWRLKEFRSMFASCRRQRRNIDIQL